MKIHHNPIEETCKIEGIIRTTDNTHVEEILIEQFQQENTKKEMAKNDIYTSNAEAVTSDHNSRERRIHLIVKKKWMKRVDSREKMSMQSERNVFNRC